nr:NAD(P)H-binding protein [Rhodococcus sp. T7]
MTGATGNIGRMLVDHLLARGATDVRALTNHPDKAQLPDSVTVAEGYLRRLDSLPAVTPAMGEYARWYLEGMAGLVDAPQQANRLVEQLTGRPATTFAQWASAHADEFSGSGSAR